LKKRKKSQAGDRLAFFILFVELGFVYINGCLKEGRHLGDSVLAEFSIQLGGKLFNLLDKFAFGHLSLPLFNLMGGLAAALGVWFR
jgi:hypothetical protein